LLAAERQVGKPLGLPKLEKPSDEDVALWHAKYVSEVKLACTFYSPHQ
jgi:hypothetical protein